MSALVATVISIVAPYLVKGSEEFAKQVGSAAFQGGKALVARLSRWWSADPIANTAVTSFTSDPEHFGQILGTQLEYALKNDPAFSDELRTLVENLEPSIDVIQRIEVAKGVTGAKIGALLQGQIRVEQHMKDAQNVVGVEAETVGGGSPHTPKPLRDR